MAPVPKADIKDLVEWQGKCDDNTSLSKLAIPGTHNSAACHLSFPSVQCQGATVTSQLEHGVRFFDVRVAKPYLTFCGSKPDDLQIIHGVFPLKLIPDRVKLKAMLREVYDFLDKHKSETVFVSLKSEGGKAWEGEEFSDIIWDKYISPDKDRWFLEDRIPNLGEARGKVILFRRFGCKNEERKNAGYGIDAAWWKYNCESDDRGKVVVQDWCEVMKPEDINKKVNVVNAHMKRAVEYNTSANADNDPKLHINFCSGSNFFNPKCWPKSVAKGVYAGIDENNVESGCGVIIIDYADNDQWNFTRSLVQMNIK